MLKLSRNGIGVLTSQYRSVLKKCAFLNLMAAGFLLFAPHAGMAYDDNVNAPPEHPLATLDTMGTRIGVDTPDEHYDYDVIYVVGTTGNDIAEIFSDANHERGWIHNWGGVHLGYYKNTGGNPVYVDTEISNKHSIPGENSSLTAKQGGGVVSSQRGSATVDRVVFNNNSVTEFYKENAQAIAAGGVIMNSADDTGSIDINGSTFTNNYTMQFVEAAGGAIYNNTGSLRDGNVDQVPGSIRSIGNTFNYNHAGNEDMSASEYDVVKNAVTTEVTNNITTVWNTQATIDEEHQRKYPNGMSMEARGGALYNGGVFTITDNTFDHNYVVAQTAFGGAVYNSLYGYTGNYTPVESREEGTPFIGEMFINGDNKFTENNAKSDNGNAFGGAIFNAGTIYFDTDGDLNLEFKDNYVIAKSGANGGAITNNKYRPEDEIEPYIYALHNATFENNYAKGSQASGGAIYNGGQLELIDATFTENEVRKSLEDQQKASGGAIYNAGTITINNAESSKDIIFTDNKSEGIGGAIFNNQGATITGTIERTMTFSGNTDQSDSWEGARLAYTPSTGGAIVGADNSVIDINLVGQGRIEFKKYAKDNVYMTPPTQATNVDGVFKVTGDNNTAYALRGESVTTNSIDPSATMISLAGSFTGAGKYILENTQLNLVDGVVDDESDVAGTGYIGFVPHMELTNVVVNMEGSYGSSESGEPGGNPNSGGFMYLSSNNDTLVDNDFYITNPKAVLYYSDYDPTYNDFAIGNHIENSGLIVYDDKPENGITRSVDGYGDLTTTGDTDVKIAKTLVNSGIVNTALDMFITQNIHVGTLESADGQIFINMDNEAGHLIKSDSDHKLIPEAPEGYDFGTYEGQHYKSEVIYIDETVTGTTKITLVDMDNVNYTQVNLDEGQRIYFARTQLAQGLGDFTWQVENAVNDNYTIKIGYDENGTVYDWFLYRVSEPTPPPPPPPPPSGLDPEDMVALSLPRASLEQLRSLRLPIDRTNRGQCSCYKDNCDNSFCQYEPGSPKTRLWATPFYRQGTFEKPFDVDFKLLGIDFGLDYQPTNTDLIGVFGSYRYGKYENDGNKKHYGDEKKYFSDKGGELELKSLVGGVYYRKYIENLYLLGAVYAGKIDADIKADNGVKGSVDGKTVGVEAEIGYDIKTTRRSTLTPSVRGTYNYIKFDKGHTSSDKKISVGKINSFEIEAALKLEYQFNNSNQLPTTGYIKPSVIQLIPDGGKVKIDGKDYKDTLDNETLGRIEIGADTNLTTGFSVGAFGNYTFGSHYDAWGVGGNVKIVF